LAAQSFSAVKGVLHTPESAPSLKSELRYGLLTAIAKARGWLDDLLGKLFREWISGVELKKPPTGAAVLFQR